MGSQPKWSNEQIKCLLDTCLEEITTVGKRGSSLHIESWNKLGKKFKERFDLDLTQKQLRNGYDTLRRKYVAYMYLRNKTGNIYNPQTQLFTLRPQEWEDFLKMHPKCGSLRTTPMPYPDLCAAIFDGSSASGTNQWMPTQTTSGDTSSSVHRVQTTHTEDQPSHDLDDADDGTSTPNVVATTHDIPTHEEEPSGSRSRPRKKAKTSVNLDDLATNMQKALEYLMKSEGPTIEECHEKLKLVGLSPVDPLFFTAFNIFGQSMKMREAWMALPSDPEVLKGWIAFNASH